MYLSIGSALVWVAISTGSGEVCVLAELVATGS